MTIYCLLRLDAGLTIVPSALQFPTPGGELWNLPGLPGALLAGKNMLIQRLTFTLGNIYRHSWNMLTNTECFYFYHVIVKQGPTRHRPMAHPVVFRYVCLRPGWDMFVLVCSVRYLVSDIPNGWPHDHKPALTLGILVSLLGFWASKLFLSKNLTWWKTCLCCCSGQ